MTELLISAFVTLLVVIDPIGMGPVFVGLTSGLEEQVRRKIALEASIIAFCVLAGSALVGDWLLARLGISLAAFRIAGGLLLFAIAFEMVFQRRTERKTDQTGHPGTAIAAFPLAIPLMAGPGAITAMVLLAGRMGHDPLALAALITIMGAMMLASYLVFRGAAWLERLLGTQGEAILGRLLGVLLAALAVQYVADGVRALTP
ncbi:MAG TPA: MarC family protein [Rhizomicrobium sp.]|jgi:multiple antibiotic resistance protein|nr:MarC family protein [Rhizomicrobium sp.]